MNPLVSVVIPAYNAAEYLPEALESVLAQNGDGVEIIVVDDGSTDATPQVISSYGQSLRCVRQLNQGVAVARNRGIEASRGAMVAFLDADDTWLPGKLLRQFSTLRAKPDSRVCHSAFRAVSAEGLPRAVTRYYGSGSIVHDLLLRGNVVGTPSTVMADRELLVRAGGFDPALSLCADWDLWIRLAWLTSFCYVDEPLVHYRQHEQNMSHDVGVLERDSLRLLQKAFSLDDLPPELRSKRRSALAFNYSVLAGSYLRAGRRSDAWRCLRRAARLRPLEVLRAVGMPWRRARRALAAPGSEDGA